MKDAEHVTSGSNEEVLGKNQKFDKTKKIDVNCSDFESGISQTAGVVGFALLL